MTSKLFVMDGNLELKVNDPKLQTFFNKESVKVASFTDLQALSGEVENKNADFCYLPSANFFYLAQDPSYKPIASALFASNHSYEISSLLIVRKDSGIETLSQLKGKSYGYINQFCTSSYFAPHILLQRNGFSFKNFFSKTGPVGAWQLQVDAVIAGVIDATMIQEDVWYALPSNLEKTKIIARVDHLPSPVVLAKVDPEQSLEQAFQKLLFSYSSPTATLFNGFVPYKQTTVEQFFQEAKLAGL